MLSLKSTANLMDPGAHQISVKQLAPMVLLEPPISLLNLLELGCKWIRLNFEMEHQKYSLWCWAAVTVSVCKFFDPSSSWTQCWFVNSVLGRNDCCNPSNDCNQTHQTDNALDYTGNLQNNPVFCAYMDPLVLFDPMKAIEQEINAGRPIVCVIKWNGGDTTHAVAITGFHSGLNMVAVSDPGFGGTSDVVLSVFQSAYEGSGIWIKTYWTKSV